MENIEFQPLMGERCKGVLRVSRANYDRVAEIANLTRQPIKVVADRLLEEALEHVKLVETKLYNMQFEE